jgi:SAM-dependent methyltransferase
MMSAVRDVARELWRLLPASARISPRVVALRRRLGELRFGNSSRYWEERYARGGNSGAGSYGRLALFKAEFLNDFVQRRAVQSVVELGCGDGHQLSLARYPSYLGFDVAPTAIELCAKRFAGDTSKRFVLHDSQREPAPVRVAELALSLDVIYHLVEDEVFDAYMRHLFAAATRYVIIYASNEEAPSPAPHVRHRRFTDWVKLHEPAWQVESHTPNRYPPSLTDGGETSFADFVVFAPATLS